MSEKYYVDSSKVYEMQTVFIRKKEERIILIGTMDDEEGRKIMYEREKILSKKIADILKSFNKDRPNWN